MSAQAQADVRAKPRHVVAAVVSVLLSMVIHVFIVENFPSLSVSRPVDPEDTIRFHPVRVEQVRPEAPESTLETPARYRPENPSDIAAAYGTPSLPEGVLAEDIPVPQPPESVVGPSRPEAEPLAYMTPGKDSTSWEPRQEILQVERKILADDVIALPRRMTQHVPRAPDVTDFTLPADSSRISQMGGGAADIPGDTVSLARIKPPPGAGGGGGSLIDVVAPPEPDAPSGLDEPVDEISDLVPTEQYLSMSIQVQRPVDEPDTTYFQIQVQRVSEASLPVVPKDVLLIQDTSESMTAWKLAECKAGLRRWLELLGPEDRFDIMGFRDDAYRCFGEWMPATEANVRKGMRFIDDLRAHGNTDVYASLKATETVPSEHGRPILAILVTDGRPTIGVTDSSDIISEFSQRNAGRLSVFTMGAGQRVNRFLLDLLSFRNRGDSKIVVDVERIPSGMERLARETQRPVLTDLQYRFSGLDTEDVYPRTLTHLYLDRPLVLSGRFKGPPPDVAFQVLGRSGDTRRDLLFPVDWTTATAADSDLRRTWAWHKTYDMIGEYTETRRSEILKDLEQVAARYNLQVPYGKDLGAEGEGTPDTAVPAR